MRAGGHDTGERASLSSLRSPSRSSCCSRGSPRPPTSSFKRAGADAGVFPADAEHAHAVRRRRQRCRGDRRGRPGRTHESSLALPRKHFLRRDDERRLVARRLPRRLHARRGPRHKPVSACTSSTPRRVGTSISDSSVTGSRHSAVRRPQPSRGRPAAAGSPTPARAPPSTRACLIVGSDGSGAQELSTGLPAAGWPTWSPDGRRIAFAGRAPGTPQHARSNLSDRPRRDEPERGGFTGHGAAGHRTVERLPTRRPTAPTRDTGRRRRGAPPGGDGRHSSIKPVGVPSWSPNGSRLAISTRGGVYLVRPGREPPRACHGWAGGRSARSDRPRHAASVRRAFRRRSTSGSQCKGCL